MPSPITATRSPRFGSACRTPCSAMAPMVLKAASSRETPSGTCAARFIGTATTWRYGTSGHMTFPTLGQLYIDHEGRVQHVFGGDGSPPPAGATSPTH